MALSVSVAIVLMIIVALLIKKAGLRSPHAAACVLLGFFLSGTSVAPSIHELTSNVAGMIGGFRM
ncbi:hypothetical protein POF50_014115 [Streptomyces sp. SL13]|uniref:DUF2304 domain-containing protein n=1 Tax=Streptantibioticus silvisoli TaxID=2705255 RepID=A0AA90H9I7_9ACTN|nr:hypothetical protein [Streptantibioticus silvisoli]MDI5963914.1 hypothetical protein [Streptantibioticus silvisoli]MDI5970462.1 hypothetical protein [Streptantibioticus silvisoli]